MHREDAFTHLNSIITFKDSYTLSTNVTNLTVLEWRY